MTPGAGPFLTLGHYFNKVGSGLLGDALYQISRFFAKKIFKVFISKMFISLCDLELHLNNY